MKFKLENEYDYKLILKAQKITCTDYKIDNENYIEINTLLSIIEDLEYEVDRLNEKYEDFKEDVEENYKRIPISQQVGISDKDFI